MRTINPDGLLCYNFTHIRKLIQGVKMKQSFLICDRHTAVTKQIKHIDEYINQLDQLKAEMLRYRTNLFTKLGQQYFYDLDSVEQGYKKILSSYEIKEHIPFAMKYDKTENRVLFSGNIFTDKKTYFSKSPLDFLRKRMATNMRGNKKVRENGNLSWYIDAYSDEEAEKIQALIKELINAYMEE